MRARNAELERREEEVRKLQKQHETAQALSRRERAGFRRNISDLEWMTPATREKALAKLDKFTPKIGYPQEWKDYSSIEIDAADLAADMAELYEPAGEDKGLEFAAEIEKGLMIEGNQPFLAQALANLIDNAIKYTPAGGAVKLRARRRSSGEIEYSVTDTGPGVPEEDRERVVQRFVRLDNSRTEPGSGLGLSLVTAVAEAHGGRVVLDEGPGAYGDFGPGLRVALVLPPASTEMSG